MIIIFQILLLIVLLSFSALFSGSETAFFSLSPLHREQLEIRRDRRAEKVLSLLKNPEKLLVGILSGNMIVNVTATVFTTAAINAMYPGRGAELSIPIMTFLLLFFGEITPKVIAARWNMRFAMMTATTLSPLVKVLFPLRILIEKISALVGSMKLKNEELTEADLRMAIDMLRRSGNISVDIIRALFGALELDRTHISKFAIPQQNWATVKPDDNILLVRQHFADGASVVVVVSDGNDVVGILEPSSLLGVPDDAISANIATPPLVVSRNIQISSFLARALNSGIQYAIIDTENGEQKALLELKSIMDALILKETYGEIQ